MDSLTADIEGILRFLDRIGDAALSVVAFVEAWLRDQLTSLGVAPQIQTLLLALVALFLILGAARLFVGVTRVAIVCILILFGLHILVPGLGA